jgi:Cu/Zn superoxide dismutase
MEGSAGGTSTDEPPVGAGGSGGEDNGGSMSDAGEQGAGGDGVGGAAPGAGGSDAAGGTVGAAGGVGAAGAGGAGEMPDAVATATLTTTGVDPGHADISGSVTFTQNGDEVTVVLELEGCPMGPHISHIHVNGDCGNEGNAAGAHWLPNGELLGDYTCEADGTASYTLTVDGGRWTIGGGDPDTDILGHSFMVHLGSSVSPGDRVACGVIE